MRWLANAVPASPAPMMRIRLPSLCCICLNLEKTKILNESLIPTVPRRLMNAATRMDPLGMCGYVTPFTIYMTVYVNMTEAICLTVSLMLALSQTLK